MHRTPPNTRIRLALILLVGVVACVVALYFTYEPKPRVTQVFVRVPTPEEIEYAAFREQVHVLFSLSKPEHQTTENAAAIAANGMRLMGELHRIKPRESVTRGWKSVQAIRSIYGDQSFVTHQVLVWYFSVIRWDHRKEYDLEVLLPILDEAYELAEAQATHPNVQLAARLRSDQNDVRLALCRWFASLSGKTEDLVNERIKRGALDEAAERLEYARTVFNHPSVGSSCGSSTTGMIVVFGHISLESLADAEAALDAARAEEGD